MMVNVKQIAKVGKVIVNIGASLYMFKEMGFFNKPNEAQHTKAYATNYYEVVDVIVCSDMLDGYKQDLIELVENFKTPSYYQAVANIVNSDMLASTKVEMIKTMSLK